MATTVTFSDEFLTTTAINRLSALRNMQFRPYRVAEAVLAAANSEGGGDKLLVPWDVNEHSVTTQHVTGYEAVDMNVSPVCKPGTDDWFFAVSPVAFSWVDEAKNAGKHKVIGLIEKRVENTDKRMHRELETQILKGTVTAMSDLLTWNGFDNTTGFLEEDAVGSQTNTVHGIAKSTYSSLPGWQNQVYDLAGDFSANGLAGLRDLHTRCREISDDPSQLKGFCSIAGAINYGRLVQGQERYVNQTGDAVKMNLVIDGITYEMSSLMPNDGGTTGTSDQEWSFLLIDFACVQFHGFPGLVMDATPFRDVGGGNLVKASFHRLAGQNVIKYFGSSGVAYGGDTY